MNGRVTTLIIACIAITGFSGLAAAATNRVVNGEFEMEGSRPTDLLGWLKLTGNSARVNGSGVGNTAAAVLTGPASIESAALFSVVAGEQINVTADVNELRDDSDGSPSVRGDSVVAIEFVNATGSSMKQVELLCDEYKDLLDNNLIDGSSTCTATSGYVHVQTAQSAITCTSAKCLKYSQPITVPAGAVKARIVLGGGLATDTVDPFVTGAGVTSPTSVTEFDNVFAGN